MPIMQERPWGAIADHLNQYGWADLGPLFSEVEMAALIAAYREETPYRRHIQMRCHGFGQGAYKYYAYPLPEVIAAQRAALYPGLAHIANDWQEKLGKPFRFPTAHADYLTLCHAAGQSKPTPLILRYQAGDHNNLHQDLYGEMVFPLQVVCLLSDPAAFTGGEFVLTEQRPRMQSRVEVVPLLRGHGIVFAVNERPADGKRGFYRLKQRHGVSTIRTGQRHTLGIIFHDAT